MGYIAPEQLRGERADARSDLLSFGCVLYEMLSGRSPFLKPTGIDIASAILNEDPPSLGTSGERVAPALQEVVRRCLEKRPADRFDSAHDLALALRAFSGRGDTVAPRSVGVPRGVRRWLTLAGAAATVVAAAVVVWQSKARSVPTRVAGPTRIAVLPFENLGSAEDAYFADGVTDEVRAKLAALPGLTVIARSSCHSYKASASPLTQIAGELNTPLLLTAKVRWQKGAAGMSRIRVTPELVEVGGPGAPTARWQASFDADLQDVFEVQSSIATKVAEALGVALGGAERAMVSVRPTANLAAYDAYLRGQEIRSQGSDPPHLRAAAAQWEGAVALDPEFALAWAALGGARSLEYVNGLPSAALAEQTREATERAVRLAPALLESRLARGVYYMHVEQDCARAREEFAAGLRANPRDAVALALLGMCDQALGRWDEAVASLELARSVNPRSAVAEYQFAAAMLSLRRYPSALAAVDRSLALRPGGLLTIQLKADVFIAQGDLRGARAVVAAAQKEVDPVALFASFAGTNSHSWVLDDAQQGLVLRMKPASFDDDRALWAIALMETHAYRGNLPDARRFAEEAHGLLAQQLAEAPKDPSRLLADAEALAYLGRREEATRLGERAAAAAPLRGSEMGGYVQAWRAVNAVIRGEYESALDLLEPLLAMPHYLSPGWLSLDPAFAPLKGSPRFEKLLKTHA